MGAQQKHEGHRAWLQEGFLSGEAGAHTEEALLELLLSYAIPQRDVQPLAKSLLAQFDSLDAMLAADASALPQVCKNVLEAA